MVESLTQKIATLSGRSLGPHSQTITDLLETHGGAQVRSFVVDDAKIKEAISSAYKFLPAAVQGVISQEKLSSFVMHHKNSLMQLLAKN